MKGQTEHNTWLSWAMETNLPNDFYAPHDTHIWMWVISYNSNLWSRDAVCFPKVAWPKGEGCFSNWWNNPYVHHLVPVALMAIGQAFIYFLIALHSKGLFMSVNSSRAKPDFKRLSIPNRLPRKTEGAQYMLNWILFSNEIRHVLPSEKHHVPQNICYYQQ